MPGYKLTYNEALDEGTCDVGVGSGSQGSGMRAFQVIVWAECQPGS